MVLLVQRFSQRILSASILFICFMSFFAPALMCADNNKHNLKKIERVAMKKMEFSDQIILYFSDKVDLSYRLESSGECVIVLDGITFSACQKLFKSSRQSLKYVKKIEIVPHPDLPGSCQLVLVFNSAHVDVSINALENPHQVIIDVISTAKLVKAARGGSSVISHACSRARKPFLEAHYMALCRV